MRRHIGDAAARFIFIRSPLIARRRYFREAGPVRRTRINHLIRISPIRLIDENNEQRGVVDTSEALRMAIDAGLDLVEISPEASPPVCKIMDYGKFKYEQSKKDQKSRAASKQAEMKEVRLGRSIKIDPHDVQIRVDQARRFLIDGHKVQLVQQFRGREMMHRDLGMDRLRAIIDSLGDVSKVETPPKQMGRRMTLILAPDRPKIEAIKRKAEKEKGVAEDAKADQQIPPAGDDGKKPQAQKPAPPEPTEEPSEHAESRN
ncbi:MAG: translation initiation factor IF-3 [Phycisphaeraceae bacterium]|nr:MAG: translation initiation factor IF-3 [Phycisphaeraceae bacterium]